MHNLVKLAGIDYSMTSPGIAIYSGDLSRKPCYNDYTFHYLTNRKTLIGNYTPFYGTEYPLWKTPEERFDKLSEWVMKTIGDCNHVRIEGYSYGSKGAALFEIGENTGVLKHKLNSKKIDFDVIAPTTIKKYATGSGRAKKGDMFDSFLGETGEDVTKTLGLNPSAKEKSPVSDMIDAYYIAKSLVESIHPLA